MGYDAAALAAILGQGQTKGPDPMAGDDPSRVFAKLTDDDRKALVVKAYEQLKVSFEKYTKPSGDKNAPARTCRDLAVAHPELPSGDYWIDPNQGDTKDSILVFCDMPKRATCVRPKPDKTKHVTYLGKPRAEVWFSEMDSGFQFTYKSDSNQLTFLQLLSTHGGQNMTYHCRNSVATYDANERSYKKALKILGWNDIEINAQGKKRFKYEVTEDECKSRADNWAKTVIGFETDKPNRLPFVDVGVFDIGEPNQQFYIEIGMACFW